MSSHDRWILGATLVTEAAWLYGVLAVLGLMGGLGESVLGWPLVILTMGVSAVLVRVGPFDRFSTEVAGLLRAAIASAFIYTVVSVAVAADGTAIHLTWIANVSYETSPERGFVLHAFGGFGAAVALWLRGAMLAAVVQPVSSLSTSFRIGLVALAFATLIDVLHPVDIGTFPVLFVFFAAGLAGLSIGSLLPESGESGKAGAWPRVITLVVAAVVAVGLVFSLVHRALLSFISDQFDTANSIVQGLMIAAFAPFAVILGLFNNLFMGFFSRPFDPEPSETSVRQLPQSTEGEVANAPRGTAGFSDVDSADYIINLDAVPQIIWFVFLAAVAVAVVVVLAIAIKRLAEPDSLGDRGEPESLMGDANPLSDLARLLANIIPRWARKGGKRRLRLPDGPPGVIEALRIYYELLTMAERTGSPRRPGQTSGEYQESLEGIFPGNLVRAATAAFNRAFYGQIPSTDKQLAEMRTAMGPIKSGPRLMKGRSR